MYAIQLVSEVRQPLSDVVDSYYRCVTKSSTPADTISDAVGFLPTAVGAITTDMIRAVTQVRHQLILLAALSGGHSVVSSILESCRIFLLFTRNISFRTKIRQLLSVVDCSFIFVYFVDIPVFF